MNSCLYLPFFKNPVSVSCVTEASSLPISFHCIIFSHMTAKVMPQKSKGIIFHCLQGRVKTSELSILIMHCLTLASFSHLHSHPVFQADEVLTVLSAHLLLMVPGPSLTVPTPRSVLRLTYNLPSKLLLILQGQLTCRSGKPSLIKSVTVRSFIAYIIALTHFVV